MDYPRKSKRQIGCRALTLILASVLLTAATTAAAALLLPLTKPEPSSDDSIWAVVTQRFMQRFIYLAVIYFPILCAVLVVLYRPWLVQLVPVMKTVSTNKEPKA